MPVNLDILAKTIGYIGRCLAFVRACLRVGPGAATALGAWKAAEHQHPGDTDPPAGVPVFWSPARLGPFAGAGHVAVSLGHGLVRSTAWPRTGRIGTVAIDELTRAWGRTYLGWTEDLNGVRVWTPTGTPATATTPATPTSEEDDMRIMISLEPSRGYWLVAPGFEHLFNQNPDYVDEFSGFVARNPQIPIRTYPNTPAGWREFDIDKAVLTSRNL